MSTIREIGAFLSHEAAAAVTSAGSPVPRSPGQRSYQAAPEGNPGHS
jgi:hypothetical protein